MVSDVGVVHNDTSLKTDTGADFSTRADDNVGTDESSSVSREA
jgi:hypothetical protein